MEQIGIENEKSNKIILFSGLAFILALSGLAWYYFSEEEKIIAFGSQGKYVRDLQEYLLSKGANLGKTGDNNDGIDGDFGKLTKEASLKYLNKETFTVKEIKNLKS